MVHVPESSQSDYSILRINIKSGNNEEENGSGSGNTVLINRKTGDEKCVKCKKNVLNGIRCISGLKAWHCKKKEDIKKKQGRHLVSHYY